MARTGPVLIAFDGSAASRRALEESAPLLAPRKALVVVVWEPDRAYDLVEPPSRVLDMPASGMDIRVAFEVEEAMYRAAQDLAQQGAAIAKDHGLDAEGLAVADELKVPDTIVRVARDVDAPAIVLGAHNHGRLSELLLGTTSQAVVRRAPCPVVVVRDNAEDVQT
jgi:nucleotide-binding universal stress UspA family protein